MFVRNPEIFSNSFRCGKNLYKYLLGEGVAPLGMKDGFYYFSKTGRTIEALKNMPWILKVANKKYLEKW